jgi:hypothetical protein
VNDFQTMRAGCARRVELAEQIESQLETLVTMVDALAASLRQHEEVSRAHLLQLQHLRPRLRSREALVAAVVARFSAVIRDRGHNGNLLFEFKDQTETLASVAASDAARIEGAINFHTERSFT